MRTIGEIVAVVGILLGLVFVGLEIRQNTVQAKAEAYQAIGFQLSELHLSMDPHLSRLGHEAFSPERFAQWSLQDWQRLMRWRVAALRIAETVQLQVEQGLLEREAMDRLGGVLAGNTLIPAHVCMWPFLKLQIGPSLRAAIEEAHPPQFECAATPALDSLMLPLLQFPPPS